MGIVKRDINVYIFWTSDNLMLLLVSQPGFLDFFASSKKIEKRFDLKVKMILYVSKKTFFHKKSGYVCSLESIFHMFSR